MIPWWWMIVALVIGAVFGVMLVAMCIAEKDRER